MVADRSVARAVRPKHLDEHVPQPALAARVLLARSNEPPRRQPNRRRSVERIARHAEMRWSAHHVPGRPTRAVTPGIDPALWAPRVKAADEREAARPIGNNGRPEGPEGRPFPVMRSIVRSAVLSKLGSSDPSGNMRTT